MFTKEKEPPLAGATKTASVGKQPVGVVLRRLREERKLTQAEVAEKAGMRAGHLSLIESGGRRSPRWETVVELATILGVSLDSLAQHCGLRSSEMEWDELSEHSEIHELRESRRLVDRVFKRVIEIHESLGVK